MNKENLQTKSVDKNEKKKLNIKKISQGEGCVTFRCDRYCCFDMNPYTH